MSVNYPKIVFAVLLSIYFLWIVYDPLQGSFLDSVDLPIHETGHLLFRPFGEFLAIAGGSLFQIIVPTVFVGYFVWNEKYYSAAITAFWVGQSIVNVFVYANDAVAMQLVLTGGLTGSEGGFHDWNYLLSETGLLGKTSLIAKLIRFSGAIVTIAAAIGAIIFANENEKLITDENN